jgi:hypothetical protein
MIPILSMFSFLICWILGVIFTINGMIIRRKLRSESKTYHSSIIRNRENIDLTRHSKTMFKMITSFGSKKSVDNYLGVFMDVSEIEELEDSNAKSLLIKLRRNTSGFTKAWVIAIISIAIAFLTWSSITTD